MIDQPMCHTKNPGPDNEKCKIESSKEFVSKIQNEENNGQKQARWRAITMFSAKFEAAGRKVWLVPSEMKTLSLDDLFLVFLSPVSLQDPNGLFVDLVVVVVLEILNLIQPITFLHLLCVQIDAVVKPHILVGFANLQNVLEALKADRYNPWVRTD